ncbi:pancreatic progenitor cell differentiation and proliferation factor B-like [Pteropus alecto]|uniref:pancreatic progenitor cell differentiation and proliferation factor B-like n=1 Tax=Pteropus alecto TaxID=9402 RepID=UPI000D531A4F|nr:pancreatic progenitor cell differentiation and proliferation factor B-like [Pteropus alecto]
MAPIPSSGSLLATNDYYRCHLGSTSSNRSCGSAEYPGEAISHTFVYPSRTRVTGGRDSFSGSPLCPSWTQSWSPQRPPNLPRPPAA